MKKIIGKEQVGGVEGRNVEDHLILLEEIFIFINEGKYPHANIITIDQEKAFDRIDQEFMFKILDKIGLGPKFIKWIKPLYTDIHSKINVNGKLTAKFKITKSIRQGDPLSMLLFAICMEPLIHMFKYDEEICGIKKPNGETVRVIAYADDITLTVSDNRSIDKIFKITAIYEKAMGAKINHEKTEIITKDENIKYLHPQHRKWVKKKTTILGIQFSINDTICIEMWENIMKKIDIEINGLNKKDITLKGRAIVANYILWSKLWYPLKIRSPPENILRKIERKIYVYIWKGNREWLKRDSCRISIKLGGMGIKCPRTMRKMFIINQLLKIINDVQNISWSSYLIYWEGITMRRIQTNIDLMTYSNTHAEYINNKRHTEIKNIILYIINKNNDWLTRTKNISYDELSNSNNWEHKIVMNEPNKNWESTWEFLKLQTNTQNYNLNFKIVHNILPTKAFLKNCKIVGNDSCVFCKNSSETAKHLFTTCPSLHQLRALIKVIVENMINKRFEINEINVLRDGIMNMSKKDIKPINKILNRYKLELWKHRNDHIFDNAEINIDKISNTIVNSL